MASPGKLVQVMAEALQLPEATIVVHDRNLVIAGLRSKGGRGLSAAKITARDVAHLLVALLASALVKDSVHSVRRYAATTPQAPASSPKLYHGLGIDELSHLPADHSFIDALEALTTSAAVGSLSKLDATGRSHAKGKIVHPMPHIEVAALTPGTLGDIRISGAGKGVSRSVRYGLPDPWQPEANRKPSKTELKTWEATVKANRMESDFEQYRRVSEKTILRVAQLLAVPQEDC